MKKVAYAIMICLSLSACEGLQAVMKGRETIIDWVDFIKIHNREYNGIPTGVIASPRYIGRKIGTVQFKVSDNVTDPNYRIRNGDAAFWEKGTEIYAVKSAPALIAIKDKSAVNGYRVYYDVDEMEYGWHFKHMPQKQVRKIELYYVAYVENGVQRRLIDRLEDEQQILQFIDLLNTGKNNESFEPNTSKGDPLVFEAVFYTNEPVAYNYNIYFDGFTYYWHPWKTVTLFDGIGNYLQIKK